MSCRPWLGGRGQSTAQWQGPLLSSGAYGISPTPPATTVQISKPEPGHNTDQEPGAATSIAAAASSDRPLPGGPDSARHLTAATPATGTTWPSAALSTLEAALGPLPCSFCRGTGSLSTTLTKWRSADDDAKRVLLDQIPLNLTEGTALRSRLPTVLAAARLAAPWMATHLTDLRAGSGRGTDRRSAGIAVRHQRALMLR